MIKYTCTACTCTCIMHNYVTNTSVIPADLNPFLLHIVVKELCPKRFHGRKLEVHRRAGVFSVFQGFTYFK